MRIVSMVMFSFAALCAQSVPSQLTVVSATAHRVVLKWSGSGPIHTVERKNGASWIPQPDVASAAFTDTSIDPMATYSYRVRAGKAPTLSAPSNEITVGPPPTGHHLLSPVQSGLKPDEFAQRPQIVLDANGDPAIAYCQGVPSKIKAMFIAWDRAHYRWKTPVETANLGDVSGNGSPIALAYDGTSNRWAMAYRTRTDAEVKLAGSTDGGETWTDQGVMSGADSDFQHVSLALSGGKGYLAVRQKENLVYVTGDESKDPSGWSRQNAPTPGDRSVRGASGLAIDSAGQPAFAYLVTNEGGDGIEPYFWRPGQAPVLIGKTSSGGPDDPSIRLIFAGTRPWVAFFGKWDEKFFSDNHSLWVAASAEGATWKAPALVPNDGGMAYASDISLTSGTKGQGAITSSASGGNTIGSRCGTPLLARSPDLVQWKTCGPSALADHINADVTSVVFATNDKLYVAYRSLGAEGSKMQAGLALWREP